ALIEQGHQIDRGPRAELNTAAIEPLSEMDAGRRKDHGDVAHARNKGQTRPDTAEDFEPQQQRKVLDITQTDVARASEGKSHRGDLLGTKAVAQKPRRKSRGRHRQEDPQGKESRLGGGESQPFYEHRNERRMVRIGSSQSPSEQADARE